MRQDVADTALGIVDELEAGIDEALIGGDVELGVALEDLGMHLWIGLYGIALYEGAACGLVALALDTLHLSQQLGDDGAQGGIVVYAELEPLEA